MQGRVGEAESCQGKGDMKGLIGEFCLSLRLVACVCSTEMIIPKSLMFLNETYDAQTEYARQQSSSICTQNCNELDINQSLPFDVMLNQRQAWNARV